MSMKKILVALDDSAQNSEVFATALDLAKTQQASLLLVHFLSEPKLAATTPGRATTGAGLHLTTMGLYPPVSTPPENIKIAEQQTNTIPQESEAWLQNYQQQAIAQKIPTEIQCFPTMGNRGTQICTLARDWNADLVIVGRKGRTGITEALLGSVSNHVLHHAPCSVFVVQEQNS